MRAIVHLLSLELFGQIYILPEFPVRPDIRGIGLSDWECYATPLTKKFDYTNTFYHREPRLDIAKIDGWQKRQLDFIIATDVFEHIAPPVQTAFNNVRLLLKPGGVLIFSVPYTIDGTTQEHFPELHHYQIIEKGSKRVLENITRDGHRQSFDQLVFHGGEGDTLEMRVFSKASLDDCFARAGFRSWKAHLEPALEYGIYWQYDWSLPITAQA
jgi:SAM-dependent methyltransferase